MRWILCALGLGVITATQFSYEGGPGEATGRVIGVLLLGLLIRLAYVKLINRNAILWTASIVAIAVVLTTLTSLQEMASLQDLKVTISEKDEEWIDPHTAFGTLDRFEYGPVGPDIKAAIRRVYEANFVGLVPRNRFAVAGIESGGVRIAIAIAISLSPGAVDDEAIFKRDVIRGFSESADAFGQPGHSLEVHVENIAGRDIHIATGRQTAIALFFNSDGLPVQVIGEDLKVVQTIVEELIGSSSVD
jgi:hypothetical protein